MIDGVDVDVDVVWIGWIGWIGMDSVGLIKWVGLIE
jgi:hypothetical protein